MFDAKSEKQPAISGPSGAVRPPSSTWIAQAAVDSESTFGFVYNFNGKCV